MADNREIARRAYAAITEKDLDAFMAIIHPDVEFMSLIAEAEGSTYRGHEGVREWWDSVANSMGGLRYEPQEIQEHGDWVLARILVIGEVAGVEITQTMWQTVRLEDGLAVWWHTYRTEREALEAIGA